MAELPELVVTRPAELTECCAHLAECQLFGFDTEFIGEEFFQPQLCLIQVATSERLFLIDPFELPDLKPFWELVADANRTAIVHAGREEIRMCQFHLGRPPGNLFDLQVAAGLIGAGYPAGHGTLVQHFLRVRLNKGETLTDWSRRPLTRQQIRYAYDDVRYLMALHAKIQQKIDALGRADWLREETDQLLRRSLGDDPGREPWRKLRGMGPLERQQLAIVREVFAWREQRAAKINRPARYVLRDDLIVEVAKRAPASDRELSVMRGVGRHDLVGLLAAIDRGQSSAEESWPEAAERDNDPPQVALVASFLMAALSSYCAAQQLTPALAATSTEIKQLIRARLRQAPAPDDLTLARGWRSQFVLPILTDLLEGRRAVRAGSLSAGSPLELIEMK